MEQNTFFLLKKLSQLKTRNCSSCPGPAGVVFIYYRFMTLAGGGLGWADSHHRYNTVFFRSGFLFAVGVWKECLAELGIWIAFSTSIVALAFLHTVIGAIGGFGSGPLAWFFVCGVCICASTFCCWLWWLRK